MFLAFTIASENRMLRITLALCLLLFYAFPVYAQGDVKEIEIQVDSLKNVHEMLSIQLKNLESQIAEMEAQLHEHIVKEQIHARGVVTTNMDASLRDEPMPGANIVRTVPQNTIVEALAYNGAYWKVRYKNTEGWVMRLFVDEGEGAELVKQESSSVATTEESMDAQKELWMREREGKKFLLTAFDLLPNSAGGISVQYAFEHLDSTRTIQEVVFSLTPYNESGAIERGRNSGASTRRLRRFGPVSVYDGEQRFQFENIWYNEKIECIQIDRIDISYANGTRNSFYKDVDTLLSSDIDNDCSITAADSLDMSKDTEP